MRFVNLAALRFWYLVVTMSFVTVLSPQVSEGANHRPVRNAVSAVINLQPVRTIVRAIGHREGRAVAMVTANSDVHVITGSGQALQSALYRARAGIKGHTRYDSPGGVGWASRNDAPNTCYGRGGANYAVVQSESGFYATKL